MSSFDFGPNPRPPVTTDRRKEQRSYGWNGASLASNFGLIGRECTIRNVSRNGAMLYVDDPLGMPAMFHIKIAGDSQERVARVRWRATAAVGVALIDQEASSRSHEQPFGGAC